MAGMNKHSGVFWLNKMKLIAGIAKSAGAQHCTCERSAAQRDFTLPKKVVHYLWLYYFCLIFFI